MSASYIPPEPPPGPASAVPPAAPPPPPLGTEPQPATSSDTGLPPHIAAGLAVLLSIVGGIIFLLLEKRNAFVRFYAMQSLILGIFSIGVTVALQIAIFILHFLPLVGGLLGILLGF